ncbi:MAG: acetylglutamate kinase [Myxococcales bacterium]|nr:acetylglutamate kinase [Myxococcales bacterium]
MSAERPVAVLKVGGDVVSHPEALGELLRDVAALVGKGWRFAICHGGGPQASELSRRLGIATNKVGGRRVTDAATLKVMKQVLAGEVNVDLVATALAAGLDAIGLSGVSAGLVDARRRPPIVVSGGGDEPVDFGYVGDVVGIRTELLEHLWAGGYTPVINTLGVDTEAEGAAAPIFNINADTVAARIAGALRADHLFALTNVPGVLRDKDDPSTRIPRLSAREARQAIADGVIVGGMIPKIEEALDNLEHGVGAVHITGARGLLAEVEAPGSHGTALSR